MRLFKCNTCWEIKIGDRWVVSNGFRENIVCDGCIDEHDYDVVDEETFALEMLKGKLDE